MYISGLHQAIAPQLKELIENAISLRMAVAYWTIKKDYLSSGLADLLKKEDSFACIDLSHPTKVSEICSLASHGANTYFYLKKINEDIGSPDNPVPWISDHLLHSKILLFDLPNSKASIWIGSHNWTDRSLSGINIETSVEVKTDKTSSIYGQMEELLYLIREGCHKVNPDMEEVYKSIQRREASYLYLHSILSADELPPKKKFFHFLGINQSGLSDFPAGRNVVLFLSQNLKDKSGYLCKAKVFKSGLLPKIEPSLNWPNLEDGYWSLQNIDGSYGEFKNTDELGKDEKSKASFYATILLDKPPEEILNIDSELSDYESVIDVRETLNPMPLEQLRGNFLWLHPTRKNGIIFQEPQIGSPNVEDYISPITPGKVAKVKIKKQSNKKKSQNGR